jgi:hypothetical protein
MVDEDRSLVERAADPYVTVQLPGVLLVKEDEVVARSLRAALHGLLERYGDRRVSIALTTLDPLTGAEAAKVGDDVALLRSAFGADQGEPMEEAARRVVRVYVNRSGRIPTARDAVVEAAMLVCRPGPGWSVEEACAVLRRGNGP